MTYHPDESAKESRGIVSSDPAHDLPVGSSIGFRPVEVSHTFDAPAVSLQRWETFEGVLLALQFVTADSHEVTGSAVMVAPGVALCARHVVEEHLPNISQGTVSAYSYGISPAGLQIWQVTNINTVPASDLTILGLSYRSALPPVRPPTGQSIRDGDHHHSPTVYR